jgi:nucleotide-binding universal stress UspA family protein
MSSIQKILFPTKFEELSFVVVQQLMSLKRAGLEEVVFLYIIDRDEVSFDLYRGFDEEYAGKLEREADNRFEDWEKHLQAMGVRARHRVEIGDPAVEILKVAREEKVDLIVAGRQRETPLEKVYLGGTSMSLVRNSEFPVLITKPVEDELGGDDRIHNPFERVLLATDFSAAAKRAQAVVKAAAGAIDEVDVVTVLDEREIHGENEAEVSAERAEIDRQLQAVAKDLAEAGEVRTHALCGKVAAEILRARDDHDATLIAVGTTGKHGLAELWLGSVSHRLAELSDVPVLLVPAG